MDPTRSESIAMARIRFGAAGLFLLLLAGGSAVAQSDAPLADALEKGDAVKIDEKLDFEDSSA